MQYEKSRPDFSMPPPARSRICVSDHKHRLQFIPTFSGTSI